MGHHRATDDKDPRFTFELSVRVGQLLEQAGYQPPVGTVASEQAYGRFTVLLRQAVAAFEGRETEPVGVRVGPPLIGMEAFDQLGDVPFEVKAVHALAAVHSGLIQTVNDLNRVVSTEVRGLTE